jgi:DnaK suppressor protein
MAGGTATTADDDAWTADELAELRGELAGQASALRREIADAAQAVAALQREASGEGSGDEADAGSKTFEREHEMSLSNNSRDLLQQVERALGRMDDGRYGTCESCGDAIPKARLQAFPRVTLCVRCKQREERR